MKFLWQDRRLFIAFFGVVCLTAISLSKGIDTSASIAAIITAIAAANAAQKSFEKKYAKGADK